MKKVLVVALSVVFSLTLCSPLLSLSPAKEPLEGWLYDHTFKMMGYSDADSSIPDYYKRKLDAKEKAFKNAKSKTFDFFVQTRYSYRMRKNLPAEKEIIQKEIKSEFTDLIDKCVPVHDTYDEDGNCELFIYIRDKSLKTKICLGHDYNYFLDLIGWYQLEDDDSK